MFVFLRNHSVRRVLAATAALIVCVYFDKPLQAEDGAVARTWTISQRFQGSWSSFGQIMKLNTNVTFNFSKHIGVDAGIPYYLVSYAPQDSSGGPVFKSGIGNVYTDLRLSLSKRLVNYTTTVSATAPTGDREKGLGTGRATLDWNNGFYRVFANRIAPYANVGVANTVSDTPFFLRPFSSEGLVSHFEAGSTLSLSRFAYVGGSGYSIVPSGQQTIVSKIVETHTETIPAPTPPSKSRGHGKGLNKEPTTRVFETVREVVGTTDLASDHGFSGWVGIGPVKGLDLTLGFSHSGRYAMDTFFWGLGFRVGPLGPKVR